MSRETGGFVWFWSTTVVLAAVLYFPTHRLIWVLRVRGAERKAGKPLSDAERAEIQRSTRLVAGLITFCFAFLFNKAVFPA